MDTSRTIKRLEANNVTIIYRRSEEEMPAEKLEIEQAKKEGINFLFKTNIVKILGENKVEKVECIKTNLIQKDGETRKIPVNIEGSNFIINADYVVSAVGSNVEKNLIDNLNIDVTDKGNVLIQNYRTSRDKIFAGGQLVGAKGTVAWAARDGRNASEEIKKYLNI